MSTNFGCTLKKYLNDVDWLGLANLSEMHILLKKSESNLIVHFDNKNIYTLFDRREQELTPSYLGDLLLCRHYTNPFVVPIFFSFDTV